MIASFGDKRTEDIFHGRRTKRARSLPQGIASVAFRKLDMINAAHRIDDLRVPPGNRLEAMRGELAGLFSIRINDQWRIVFGWAGDRATDVQIVDYQ